MRDLAYAARHLRRNPSFTVVAVLALALGIGANATVFGFLAALVRYPDRIGDADRTVYVFTDNREAGVVDGGVSVDDFLDLAASTRSFEALAVGSRVRVGVAGSGDPIRMQAYAASPGLFAALAAPIVLGRGFEPADGEPGAAPVAVLSHRLWRDRFAGREEALGETLRIDGAPTTIVGVVTDALRFPTRDTLLYLSTPLARGREARDVRDRAVVGRLAAGVSSLEATAEARTVFERLAKAYPETHRGWTPTVVTVRENFLDDVSLIISLLYSAITLVLLIACANVASLLFARATARAPEVAVRRALGATRPRILRQLLAESLLLAALGGLTGLVVGLGGIQVVRRVFGADANVAELASEIRPSAPFVLHTLAVTAVAALLFGLLPALRSSRPSLVPGLRQSGRGGGTGARGRAALGLLVVVEVAAAMALLGLTGASVRAFGSLFHADPGFTVAGLLTGQVALAERDYPEPAEAAGFFARSLSTLEATPGVAAATYASVLPLTERPGRLHARLEVEGAEVAGEEAATAPDSLVVAVGPRFFETLQVPILEGSGFGVESDADALPVAVLNRAAAERWDDGVAVGRRIRLAGPASGPEEPWRRVVGVVGDVQIVAHSLRQPRASVPVVFVPHGQRPSRSAAFLVRAASGDPSRLADGLRQAVWSVDPRQPIDYVETEEQVIARVDSQYRFFVRVLSGLAVVALCLAAVGIYGVVTFATGLRRHEIGVRVALGAGPASVAALVVRHAVVLTSLGLVAGLGLAVALVRLMSSQLAGMAAAHADGPLTFLCVAALFLLIALVAGYQPARRAIRADPVEALRTE